MATVDHHVWALIRTWGIEPTWVRPDSQSSQRVAWADVLRTAASLVWFVCFVFQFVSFTMEARSGADTNIYTPKLLRPLSALKFAGFHKILVCFGVFFFGFGAFW